MSDEGGDALQIRGPAGVPHDMMWAILTLVISRSRRLARTCVPSNYPHTVFIFSKSTGRARSNPQLAAGGMI